MSAVALQHHGEKERHEIFPKVMKAGIDLKALGTRIRLRRQELAGWEGRERAREILFNLGMTA